MVKPLVVLVGDTGSVPSNTVQLMLPVTPVSRDQPPWERVGGEGRGKGVCMGIHILKRRCNYTSRAMIKQYLCAFPIQHNIQGFNHR